jgi:hypothetical protein
MKVRLVELEGTAVEINEVLPTIQPMPAGNVMSGEPPEDTSSAAAKTSEGPTKFVTVDFARRVLTRLPLSKPFKALIQTLNEAHPNRVLSAPLYDATGYNAAQFAGLMGAFGRRVTHTEGFEKGTYFFDYKWNGEANQYEYRFPESVREAVSLENLA